MNVQPIKLVKLLEVVKAAGEDSWGGNPIWDEMIDYTYGNQVFGNDMIFRYVLPSINGEDLSPVQQRIADVCADVIEDDTIYFDVSW